MMFVYKENKMIFRVCLTCGRRENECECEENEKDLDYE